MRNGEDQKFSMLIFKGEAKVTEVSGVWSTDLEKWCRFQLSVIGPEFRLKGKERTDETAFNYYMEERRLQTGPHRPLRCRAPSSVGQYGCVPTWN